MNLVVLNNRMVFSIKPRVSQPKFHGFDYSELAPYFGVKLKSPYNLCLADVEQLKIAIDERVREEGVGRVATILRDFVKALLRNDTEHKPIWRGLLRIRDSYAFICFAVDLLPKMWTN